MAAPERRHPKSNSCYLLAFLNNLMGSGNCSAAALWYESLCYRWELKKLFRAQTATIAPMSGSEAEAVGAVVSVDFQHYDHVRWF